MRGSKSPTEVKKIMGNPGHLKKDKLENVAQFKKDEFDLLAPKNLKGLALEKWNELAKILNDAAVFTSGDRELLARYCRWWPSYVQAWNTVEVEGEYSENANGSMSIAAHVHLLVKLEPLMNNMLYKLGLSPVDRSRVNSVVKEEKQDPKDRFFN